MHIPLNIIAHRTSHILFLSILLLFLSACSSYTGELDSNMSEVIHIRSNGADMPAYIHGNGNSKTFIIIVHGGPGGNGLEYRCGSFAETLEENYAVVYWDQRGQGTSHGHYNSDDDLSIEQLVADLNLLVRTLKSEYGDDASVFLLGHSWGGTLGTAYVLAHQNTLNGWIEASGANDNILLNEAAVRLYQRVGAEQIALDKNVDFWTEAIETMEEISADGELDFDDGGIINNYGHQVEAYLEDEIIDANEGCGGLRSSFFFSPTNMIASGISGNNTNGLITEEIDTLAYTDRMHRITIPCLYLYGKYDFICPAELGETALANISSQDKEFIIFENSGHSPMDNEPEAFTAAILQFVERNR